MFGQYSIYWSTPNQLGKAQHVYDDDAEEPSTSEQSHTGDEKPNIVARGLEKSGLALRKALRGGGKMTGKAIRYLGDQYTAASLARHERQEREDQLRMNSQNPQFSAQVAHSDPDFVDPILVERADRQKRRAEDFHAGVRTLASAALYPVRWTGQQASILAQHDSNAGSRNKDDKKPVKRAVLDTIGGLGNGVVHAFKV
jgi:hypothetical protein